MTMGEKILMLRKAREMSQEQLAERLGVSRQAVSKWELNEAVPDVNRVVAMSELFGVTTDYLLKDGNDGASCPQGVENECPADKTSNDLMQPDRKWLGMVLALIGTLGILVMWAVMEIKNTTYISDYYVGTGLVGYLHFSGWGFLGFILLVLCLIGGIRILMGKPFLFKLLTPSYWRNALDASDGIFSEETKQFLQEDDTSSAE